MAAHVTKQNLNSFNMDLNQRANIPIDLKSANKGE